LSPIFTRTLLALCVLALSLFVAACGDDDSSESSDDDPATVLEETFGNAESIASGDLNMSLSASAEGREGGSIEATISGPFQGDPDDPTAIPQLDLEVSATGEGFGETLDFEQGVTITEDNVYLEIQGKAYELGAGRFARLKDSLGAQIDSAESAEESSASFTELCTQALERAGGDASVCDIDLVSWLTNLTNEGTEDVGGAEAVHIAGDANVEQILTDVGELIGAFAGPLLEGFDPSALGTFSEVVSQASIDVYSGVDDRLLRGLDAEIVIDPSALGVPVPIETIDAAVSVEIAGVNEEQTIEAPADPRPYEELPGGFDLDLGGLGLGGGELGLGGGGASAEKCLEDARTPRDFEECLR
jgi:hypothetical protein